MAIFQSSSSSFSSEVILTRAFLKWFLRLLSELSQYDLVNKFEISIQKVLYRTHFCISTKGSVEKIEKNQNTSAILEVFKKTYNVWVIVAFKLILYDLGCILDQPGRYPRPSLSLNNHSSQSHYTHWIHKRQTAQRICCQSPRRLLRDLLRIRLWGTPRIRNCHLSGIQREEISCSDQRKTGEAKRIPVNNQQHKKHESHPRSGPYPCNWDAKGIRGRLVGGSPDITDRKEHSSSNSWSRVVVKHSAT